MCSPGEIFINVYSEKLLFLTFAMQVLFSCNVSTLELSTFFLVSIAIHVIVIDLFNETVLFNHRGGRSPPRLLNRQSS